MRRSLILAALALSACGQGATGDASSPPPPPRPEPTPAERAALLAALPAPWAQGDVEHGRTVFARCRACHTITEGGPNMTGPNLWGLFGRIAGTHAQFSYSPTVKAAGFAWDAGHLDTWVTNPQRFLPGTKMAFAGLSDATDRRDVIAFLKVETSPTPPAAAPATGPAATPRS